VTASRSTENAADRPIAGGIYHVAGPFSLLFWGGPKFEHRAATGVNAYAALGLSF
jgi:hypothetical protein